MKINEVEALAGITKKNIRFYEEQGLLSPRRNAENGYRDYGEEEVRVLRQIKLMRKLGVPIEEIRRMIAGSYTVGDCMRRHLVFLERDQRNLEQSMILCRKLQNMDVPMESLDAEEILTEMEEMEKGGASFQDKQTQDVRVRYVAPILITVLFVGLLIGVIFLILWAYAASPEEAPPMGFLWFVIAVCVGVGAGVIMALTKRIQEIGKGEIDDARLY